MSADMTLLRQNCRHWHPTFPTKPMTFAPTNEANRHEFSMSLVCQLEDNYFITSVVLSNFLFYPMFYTPILGSPDVYTFHFVPLIRCAPQDIKYGTYNNVILCPVVRSIFVLWKTIFPLVIHDIFNFLKTLLLSSAIHIIIFWWTTTIVLLMQFVQIIHSTLDKLECPIYIIQMSIIVIL